MMVAQRILCALAMLAVLMGPASVDAAAAAMASSGGMAGMSMEQAPVEEAMADMPCCPEEKKPAVPDCTKSCPLALVCSTAVVGILSASAGMPLIHPLPLSFPPVPGEERASALVEPPPRPPRV